MGSGNEKQSERLDALLKEHLGAAARVIPQRDRRLALELLAPDETIRSVAMGRMAERSLVTGQLLVATDTRLIISEAHRWKASWHRSLPWADVDRLALDGSDLIVDVGPERITVKSVAPVTSADQFVQLWSHRGGGPVPDGDLPVHQVSSAFSEQLFQFRPWLDHRAVHRLSGELAPGETIVGAARFGVVHSGVVILTDRRIGRLPDSLSEPSTWFDRDGVRTISLDDDAGLLLRTPDGDVEWTGLLPADEVPSIVDPLLADNRRRARATITADDPVGTTPSRPSELPEGIRRTEVDGVPVFWADRPVSTRLTGQLFFGVGQADESFLQGQITHLLERVVMRRFADAAFEVNAGVGIWITSFDVESRPATVARHLREVCDAIGDVATGRLDAADVDAERAVLRAEAATNGGPGLAVTLPAAAWFGRASIGLTGESTLGLDGAQAADLADWCRRWLVRGNAALVLDGPPPADLTLPLPAGPRTVRDVPATRPLNTPAWTPGPPGFQVSFRAQRTPVTEMLIEALTVRWTRLMRHDGGLVYDVGVAVIGLPGSEVIVSIAADAAADDSDRVIAALRIDLETLQSVGFTDAEITAARERLAEQADDPDRLAAAATDHAVESVGGPAAAPVGEGRTTDDITRAEVDAAWRAARSSLIVAVDGELPGLDPLVCDDTPPVTGRHWTRARRGSFVIGGSEAISGPDGVSLRWGPAEDSDWRTVRYDEVVALGIDRLAPQDCVVVLFGRSGALVGIRARDWRDGDNLVREILLTVPPHLHVHLPDDTRPFDIGEE